MIAAFIIGFVGSLHCVGMCGPFTLLMMSKNRPFLTFALYHGGRILIYVLLGTVFGLIGQSLQFFRVQQTITIALGVALLFLYGAPSVRNKVEKAYYQSRFSQVVRHILSENFSKKNRWIVGGAANGFLPCGLTYVAVVGALVLPGRLDGVLFMVFFGLGTVPALLLVGVSGSITSKLGWLIPNSISFVAILSGVLLITRGFLVVSPDFNQFVQAKAAVLITICGL